MNFQEFKQKYEHKKVEEYPNRVSANPLVSVCVQTYNQANYIKQCLDGILMQKTNFSFEILLGEDDSTDGAREICVEYAQKHPDKIRLFLHHRENNIKINNRPTGRFNFIYNLLSANGKYIAICEGDDYLTDPYKLQKQVDFMRQNKEFAFCYHNVYLIDKDKNRLNSPTNDGSIIHYHPKELKIEKVPTMAMMYKTKSFQKVSHDFVEEVPWGDVFLKAVLTNQGPFAKLNFIGGEKRMVDGVSIAIDLFNKYKNSKASLKYTEEHVKDRGLRQVLKRRRIKIFWVYTCRAAIKLQFKQLINIIGI